MPAHHRMRAFDRDLIRGGHYGQRSCEPRSQAEHMAAPTKPCDVKILLANQEPSTHGTSPRGAAKVAHYLAEAEFCAELAESIKRPDYKDRWLKIAQEWRDLANQARTGGKATQYRHVVVGNLDQTLLTACA